jgi:prevent-host-death family protein
MERIGVRELRQHASRYLDRVKAGETVEVTERGRLVALLVPPHPSSGPRDDMIAAGLLVPATRPFQPPRRVSVLPGVPDTGAILDDLRRDDP